MIFELEVGTFSSNSSTRFVVKPEMVSNVSSTISVVVHDNLGVEDTSGG